MGIQQFKWMGLLLCFLPTIAFAGGFFDRKVAEERSQWEIVKPDELIEALFPEEKKVSEEFRIEINIPERKLTLFQGNEILQTHRIAVGSYEHKTPLGPRYLESVTWNPWWFPPKEEWAKDEKVTPPGPANPLGIVKMSLGGDIFLHGTNAEGSVGRPVSHGCMRMKNREARELAWFLQRRFSSQTDEKLLGKYEKQRQRSFYVKLDQRIPVTITYDRVAIRDNEKMEIYPDIYRSGKELWRDIFSELSTIGIPPWEVDPVRLDELEKAPGPMTVSIRDLLISFVPLSSPEDS